ncbi:MexE family multidrug efflux RND transporter periplasmic adaptor subunit [Allostella sp. ATCC 35155]|nr:MexE family multidrug efflux RND transporter periplasmic adaptor subunit [Stella sp. ATCC 35155]
MGFVSVRTVLIAAGVVAAVGAGSGAVLSALQEDAPAATAPAAPAPVPVSVASVIARDVTLWSEFSGRLEAIDRVDIRPRVTGSVQAVHFREGALVQRGDRLFTIDPAPYETEIQRLTAQVLAAQSRLALTRREQERGQQMLRSGMAAISQANQDQRVNAFREAEANLRTAEAALAAARLDLGYTQIHAPIAGRVGKVEVTVGNLVAAGAGGAVLTTIVSVDPIYAAFSADEDVVTRAIAGLPPGMDSTQALDRIPVEMETAGSEGRPVRGRLQLIDNQIDPGTGTVRMRAVFDNPGGRLMPGQFARLRMGSAEAQAAILVTERAVGTDQGRKFVMVVGDDGKAAYREVVLGPSVDGLRVVRSGLKAGERIVVNGLHRVRPGAAVQPQIVAMAPEAR